MDAKLARSSWDLLLIDVEGHEENVLKGAKHLLNDPARRPAFIMIEVHPYAWEKLGNSSDNLLLELSSNGYCVTNLQGEKITHIDDYGHIIASLPEIS